MVLGRRRGKARGGYGAVTGAGLGLGGAREVDVNIILSDSSRKHRCSEGFVNDLCDRVMKPALQELDRLFGEGWGREIAPSIILEGPALAFRITVVKVAGWEVNEMCVRINDVFSRHWELEIDRVPPR